MIDLCHNQESSNSLTINAVGNMFLFPFIILCRWVRRHDFSEKERDETLCYHSPAIALYQRQSLNEILNLSF